MDKAKARQIYNLIAPFVKKGEIIARSFTEILTNIDDFIIIEIKQKIVACCGIRTYSNLKEIYCLAVDINFHNQGLSKQILQKIESNTKGKIIALSKYQSKWFINNGFTQIDVKDLSQDIKYNNLRKPNIFMKLL